MPTLDPGAGKLVPSLHGADCPRRNRTVRGGVHGRKHVGQFNRTFVGSSSKFCAGATPTIGLPSPLLPLRVGAGSGSRLVLEPQHRRRGPRRVRRPHHVGRSDRAGSIHALRTPGVSAHHAPGRPTPRRDG